jgi:hypothetical protein
VNGDPGHLAATLTQLENVTGVWDLIESRLRAGDANFVVDLGIALWRRYGTDAVPPWQFRSVFDRTLRLLTLTSGTIEHAVRLISVVPDRRKIRYAASLLASAHTVAELGLVFDAGRSEELRACLTQELVLRGVEVRHPWAVSPHWRFHPLGWLPLSLTSIEGRPGLPKYSSCSRRHRPAVPTTTASFSVRKTVRVALGRGAGRRRTRRARRRGRSAGAPLLYRGR